jgi:hypothetical protein
MNQLRALRIPLFLIGLALIFIAERYLKTYDSYPLDEFACGHIRQIRIRL